MTLFFGHFPFDGVRKYIKTNGYVLQRFHATQARVIYIIGVPKELYYKAWLQQTAVLNWTRLKHNVTIAFGP